MLDVIFPLLRSSLFGTPLDRKELPDDIDWNRLIKTASKQTVLGLVADAVGKNQDLLDPPKEVIDRLRKFMMLNMATHNLLNTTLSDFVSLYDSNGIPGILLKGQGVALCYTNPLLRQCGDIDYYVGEGNYTKACEIVINDDAYTTDKVEESSKHYSFNKGKVSIEVHRKAAVVYTPWLKSRFKKIMAEGLDHSDRTTEATFNGTNVRLPGADFNAFFIFFHLWHHFHLEGVGLRQLCDWAMVLHKYKDEIDRNTLYDNLKALGLLKIWQAFGYIIVNFIGLPQDEMPFYNPDAKKAAMSVLASIDESGNFGHYSKYRRHKHHRNKLLHKLQSFYIILRIGVDKFRLKPDEITSYVLYRFGFGLLKLFLPSTWKKLE